MVSLEQLTSLIDFMEEHKDLALGRFARSKEGRSQTKRLWIEVSNLLNGISPGCVTKTGDQWRLYYNEYKSKLLKKIKADKAEISATGGGPHKVLSLTSLQERLYGVLGTDIGEPLPGVRHNPIPHRDQTARVNLDAFDIEDDIDIIEEEQNDLDGETHSAMPLEALEPNVEFTTELASNNGGYAADSNIRQQQTAHSTPAPKRPRRRRRQARSSSRTEDEPALRQASSHLAAMESLSAEATREHAKSILTLAAAIDNLAQKLTTPIAIKLVTVNETQGSSD